MGQQQTQSSELSYGVDAVDDAPPQSTTNFPPLGDEGVAGVTGDAAAVAVEESPCSTTTTPVEEVEARQMSASGKAKKKNFSLKKQLSKVDSKMRDLLVSASRRGSAVGGGVGATVTSSSTTISPQDEQPPTSFPFPAGDESSCESHHPADEEPIIIDDDNAAVVATTQPQSESSPPPPVPPTRPPRRLKKAHSVQQPSTTTSSKPVCSSNRPDHSSWKRTWNSNDETSSNSSATAILPYVLDLRMDTTDEPGHSSGFIDNFVRKFRKRSSSLCRTICGEPGTKSRPVLPPQLLKTKQPTN